MNKIVLLLVITLSQPFYAQHNNPNSGYWQQQVDYKMEVDVDADNFTYTGKQVLAYTNNSPEVLTRVYYHLFFNAFQPGSAMDARLQNITDPDKRMMSDIDGNSVSSISTLKPNEIGYLKVRNLKQDGKELQTKLVGTILEVTLAKPILPKEEVEFTLDFEGQIPVMVRRAGRNSKEGVALSMAQWYPKMAEFDFEGWHADPYLGREFHGVWGNFDVKISLDKNYLIGASGYLMNKNEIGFGYQDEGVKVSIPKDKEKLTWHFTAPNVHDFTWAADTDYIHDKVQTKDDVTLHFIYKNNDKIKENWKKLQPETVRILGFYNQMIGKYPYKQYSVIQGGDGGMEYAMCTLITGERSYNSLLGVTAHELAHSWFQHLLATNESKHEWMDEGFTSFISDFAIDQLMDKGDKESEDPFSRAYDSYYYMVKNGANSSLATHADRYHSNLDYSISAYNKGTVFLTQLAYVVGWHNVFISLGKYYNDYKFSHPTPNDFKRTVERVTGAVLDWYLVDWTQTNNTIDYAIKNVNISDKEASITLERKGLMPMPIDLMVEFSDGTLQSYYLPNTLMRWNKPNPYNQIPREVLQGWDWAYSTYTINLNLGEKKIKKIIIDPSDLMADIDKTNNIYSVE